MMDLMYLSLCCCFQISEPEPVTPVSADPDPPSATDEGPSPSCSRPVSRTPSDVSSVGRGQGGGARKGKTHLDEALMAFISRPSPTAEISKKVGKL